MRRQRYPIHTQPPPGYLMHHIRNTLDVMDIAQHIARMGAAHQSGLLG